MKRLSTRHTARSPTAKTDKQKRPSAEQSRSTRKPENELEFSKLYGAWQPKVRRWVASLGAPAGDIDDVTQEVFIIVRRKLSDFQPGNFAGWLYRITERTVRDFRRKASSRYVQHGSSDKLDEMPTNEDLEALYDTRETLQRVAHSLARMSLTYREIFVQFAVQGYSGEEIAALHQIPIATVWSRIHRARKELSRSMRACVARPRDAEGGS